MSSGSRRWLARLCVVLAALGVLSGGLDGPFVYDDVHTIVEDPAVRELWPPFDAREGSNASGRPLVALSLALNHALGGLGPRGYHTTNALLHALNALLLLELVRRLLQRTRLRSVADGTALAAALVFAVHPLATDALLQVASRGEVLVATFTLVTLLVVEGCLDGTPRQRQVALATLACAGAMASKEIAVSLPLVALAMDRTFSGGSLRDTWRTRRGLYLGLAASWVVLGVCLGFAERGQAVGFGRELGPLDYLRTQAQALPHYIRLTLWPTGLSADYSGWEPVRSWAPALLPGALVLGLLLTAAVGLARGRGWGWLGLALFAVLAPSSSFLPITGEWIAEHRMYLPLAGLTALGASAVAALLLQRPERQQVVAGALVLTLVGLPLGVATYRRTQVWSDETRLWTDVLATYPDSPRAHDSLAVLALREGRLDEALGHAREARRLAPELYTVDYNLGTILLMRGEAGEAVEALERAREHLEGSAGYHANLGAALGQAGREADAIRELRRAVALDPDQLRAHRNLAVLHLGADRPAEALPHLSRCVESAPNAWVIEAAIRVLAADPDGSVRDGRAALGLATQLARSAPGAALPLSLLGMALAETGDLESAKQRAEEAREAAGRSGDARLVEALERQLEAYRAGRPWRERYRP